MPAPQPRDPAPPAPVPSGTSPALHAARTAVVFEGGGMRASYTSGILVALLELGVVFDFVGGISAGAGVAANYLHSDVRRARAAYTDIVADPRFGGPRTFVQGKGYFSARWIYQEACLPNNAFPYDFERFEAHPAQVAIQAFDRATGASKVWTRADMPTLQDLMLRVRASSTLPIAMPPVVIDGRSYYDGGLGEGGGIPLHLALNAGFERVFVVLSRPRGYRKRPPHPGSYLLAGVYARHRHLREALLTRHERYNAALEQVEDLAAQGSVYAVYANDISVTSGTTHYPSLVKNFNAGYAQAQAELPLWRDWLGV